MDKVQFQLESTLPELKDLHEKGLFSRIEINQITKRRTQFESSLIKKGNSKEDFFRYAEYEIGLEMLRRVRWKRLGYDKDPPPPSASSFSIPRRVMYILKRATAKYPADLATWLAYIEYAGRERMRKIVSKGLTSALQHHPLSPTLYLLSSFNHLHPGAPFPRSAVPVETSFALPSSSSSTAKVSQEEEDELANSYAIEGTQPARTTLMLGLRMLPKSHDLWREYIKLELQWVEVLRRRWKVLGIDGGVEGIVGGEGAFGEGGEEARKAILGGQLVLQAIRSALEGVPADEPEQLSGEASGMAFRQGLLEMLRSYPSPLRIKCLDVVYADLEKVGGEQEGLASLMLLTKGLYDRPYDPAVKDQGAVVLQGVELVEEMGRIGKAIKGAVKNAGPEFGLLAGQWLDERIRESEDDDLRQYLLSILSSLAKPSLNPTPALVLIHMSRSSPSPQDRLSLLEKHTARNPANAQLQLLRLQALLELPTAYTNTSGSASLSQAANSTAEEIAKAVSRSQADMMPEEMSAVSQIWAAWFDAAPESSRHAILLQSLRQPCASLIHPALLSRFYASASRAAQSAELISLLHTVRQKYRPSPPFYASIFDSLAPADHAVAKVAYEHWTRTCTTKQEKVEAGLTYAGLLMRARKGREANDVIGRTRGEVQGSKEEGVLERGWERVCREAEEDGEEGADEDGLDEQMGEGSDGEDGSGSESEEEGLVVDGDGDVDM